MQKTIIVPIDTVLNCTINIPSNIKMGDTLLLKFMLFECGLPLDVEGQTVNIELLKADGKEIDKIADNINGNVVTKLFDKQATACNGKVYGEVCFTDSNGITITNDFIYYVKNSYCNNAVIKSEDDIQTLEDMRAIIRNFEDEISAIGSSAEAVSALNSIKKYIDDNLPQLINQNSTAAANISSLKNQNTRSETNIGNLKTLNSTAEDKLDEFRNFDPNQLIPQVRANTAQLNQNTQNITTANSSIDTLSRIKAEKTDLEKANENINLLNSNKANKSDLSSPFNFKGSCLSTALPANASVNDTWYCTDLKYRKTWNGTAWYQSSLEETDYIDELSDIKNDLTNLSTTIDITGLTWKQGSYNLADGITEQINNKYIYSTDYIELSNNTINVENLVDYLMLIILEYDESKKYKSYQRYFTAGQQIKTDAKYIKVEITSNDSRILNQTSDYKSLLLKQPLTQINEIKENLNNMSKNLNSANEILKDFTEKIVYSGVWEHGNIDENGKNDGEYNKVIRTVSYIEVNKSIYSIECTESYSAIVHVYDTNKKHVGFINNITNASIFPICTDGYIRILVYKTDRSEVLNQNDGNVILKYIAYKNVSLNNMKEKLISSSLLSNIMSGTTISKNNHKLAIPDDYETDDKGNVYVSFYSQDDGAHEGGNTAHSILSIFNILEPSKYNEYTIFKSGDVTKDHGTIIYSHDMAVSFINESNLRLVALIHTETGYYIGYRDFNVIDKSLSDINICNFKAPDNNTYEMRSDIIKTSVIPQLNLKDIGEEVEVLYMPQIIKIGNSFYSFACLGWYSHVLIKSADCITWEMESDIPTGYPIAEGILGEWKGKLIVAPRGGGNGSDYYPLNFMSYNISNKTWTKINIPKINFGAQKPALAIHKNFAYIMIWTDNNSYSDNKQLPRTHKTIYKIDLNSMRLVNQIEINYDFPQCDNVFAKVGTCCYLISSTDRRGFILNGESDGRSEISISYFNVEYLNV